MLDLRPKLAPRETMNPGFSSLNLPCQADHMLITGHHFLERRLKTDSDKMHIFVTRYLDESHIKYCFYIFKVTKKTCTCPI